ncbi:hypothetical protein POVWA2_020100 [Plasmodium ovale wallikeri]|uniref:Uncharacterized protein n=1 Tax=Plasmodium ovale wallikeri TaxID=864142 RepID=A0A1A8YS98_PLAOA|nr:hypothetical protein POVWA1_019910 [Plasmodium ovale wallikeri]SBT34520.1 hypothetical protein POVWA2_020100 [Plasmodium ovale wallikeri]
MVTLTKITHLVSFSDFSELLSSPTLAYVVPSTRKCKTKKSWENIMTVRKICLENYTPSSLSPPFPSNQYSRI